MQFTPLKIEGAWAIAPVRIEDERGWFSRLFCEEEFAEHGLETRFVQHSASFSRVNGTLRGMHYQKEPHSETKLVSCVQGRIWDVIIDLRPDSPSYLDWLSLELSAEEGTQFYIPRGCAHGFQTLMDDVIVHYLISEFHAPDAAGGIRFDDPVVGIDWPNPPTVISSKDLSWPFLSQERRNFETAGFFEF
ncbi:MULTISPECIES: dTDP-4-dehydrorhamnose 3,5-epimerase [Phyllobacteriaceae]|uniref:dTDP-4-dehydrorhamnose 3,5-epimerase n=1 Tax=Phyllobacterium phragmitis TaxID=2670329 RepID=A0ABQ0GW24_9HYPH|nr:dTDP-4-dehydrorhamnose 3,5-epimerase [Mesorhizobium sp. RMAD-H1]MBB2969594.1 dTDP-4-dehydrorhamnose 3,5-epimerase [Mesorhizobium sp. RMAD-H1]